MHVKAEVEGLEKKVDSGFAEIKSAIEGLQRTMAAPPPLPSPRPAGGSEVRQGLRSSPLSFADAASSLGGNGGGGQQPVADVTTPAFNRKPNPTKLFCNLHDRAKVSQKQFRPAISELANEANISDNDFEVIGDALDNRFELQFLGDGRIPSVLALQFYESLQLGRGNGKNKLLKMTKKTLRSIFTLLPIRTLAKWAVKSSENMSKHFAIQGYG